MRNFLHQWSRTLASARRNAGFTLLFAALIASIVLALGAAIFDISIKQVELSSASQNSQYAFYAADTAANCALYWDERFNYFATVTPAVSPSCNDQSFTASPTYTSLSPATYPYTQTYSLSLYSNVSAGYCTQVSVTKSQSLGSGGVDVVNTTIQANGYNVPCTNLSAGNALQRTVDLNY